MLKRAATALAIWNTVACAQEQEPCKAPHPLVPQSHPAPRTPNIAIVALVYDGSSITPQDLEARFSGPAVDYIKRVSQGCTKITYVPFVANIPASENGTPCYTQSDQYHIAFYSLPQSPKVACTQLCFFVRVLQDTSLFPFRLFPGIVPKSSMPPLSRFSVKAVLLVLSPAPCPCRLTGRGLPSARPSS